MCLIQLLSHVISRKNDRPFNSPSQSSPVQSMGAIVPDYLHVWCLVSAAFTPYSLCCKILLPARDYNSLRYDVMLLMDDGLMCIEMKLLIQNPLTLDVFVLPSACAPR